MTCIKINSIVDYLNVFNIFLMNCWYAEGFYAPKVSEKIRSVPKNFWTYELNRYFLKAYKGSKYGE